jgi:hypothetical protein
MMEGMRLRELVEEVLARLDAGEPGALDAACAAHPDLAEALRRRIGRLGELGFVPPSGPATPPERIGGFTLLERIGAGGMGVVYRARQDSLGRQVALKLIRPDVLHLPRSRERFARETAVVARLQHPGIVPIYTVGDGDLPWYAMEHVPGCTLAEALRELEGRRPAELTGADLRAAVRARSPAVEPAPEELASPVFAGTWEEACLAIARMVAVALEHAHARGVLHRDVKPSNVMITPGGRVMLLDFGLSRAGGGETITRAGDRVGSLPYMAPELLRDGPEVLDRRSDVYALGVTLYQMLTLQLPYEAESVPVALAAILEGRPARPRARNAALSWEAETVCLAAMERDPERRYASAADLARDVANALARRPVEARRASAALRLRRWTQRHPGAASAVLLAVLLPTVAALLLAREARRVGEALARAEEGFGTALDAVDRMLTEVGLEDLAEVPAAQPVRRRLLQEALAFYERFAEERAGDPALRGRVAKALYEVGRIHALLGEHDEAVAAQRRAIETCAAMAAGADAEARGELALQVARCRSSLGVNLQVLGSADAALIEAEAAVSELDALAARRPDDAACAAALGQALQRLSGLMAWNGRDGWEEPARRAVAALAALSERDREDARSRQMLGSAWSSLGMLLLREGRVDEARDPLERSIAIRTSMVEEGAADREVRNGLALGLMNLGILRAQRDPEGSAGEDTLRRAIPIARALCADFPSRPDLRGLLGDALSAVATALHVRGEHALALPLLEESLVEMRLALRMVPEDRARRRSLAYLYRDLFRSLGALGRHAEIAARSREAAELVADDADPLRLVEARALACAAGAVAGDAALALDERGRTREAYVQAMVACLREMARAGWSDAEALSGGWLDEVRGHPDVALLLADLAAR